MEHDRNAPAYTGARTVNPNTHQKFIFCARLHTAAGLALPVCPERPGAALQDIAGVPALAGG
jgi:hypothetical protein